MSRKHVSFLLLLILLVSAGLRCYRLDYQSFWNDEIITYDDSKHQLSRIISNPYDPNIPPLYYLITHFIMDLGDKEWILRFPSVLFSVLSVFLFYLVLNNWLGRKHGLMGALVMALSPFHIWYSQEARPYALLILLSLLSLWLLQLLTKNPRQRGLRIAFVVASAATFYCHTVAIAFIGFLVIYVLLVTPRDRWKEWMFIFGSILLIITPALSMLILDRPVHAENPFKAFNLLSIPYTLYAFGAGYSVGPTLTELHAPDRMIALLSYLPIILPVMLLFSILCLRGAIQTYKTNISIFWSSVLWFVFPMTIQSFDFGPCIAQNLKVSSQKRRKW